MKERPNYFVAFFILLCFFSTRTIAQQPGWTFDPFGKEKKPVQYEEKKLRSEKTGDKKFTGYRRFVQNNITHYNFYFNANTKIKTVLERAKLSQKDDYSQLLPFYAYSLQNTASQKTELDSVIYKSTAAILLHDLRTDWVDNMYLLIGQAYYYRNELDSAALTFQFINYNLFPRKRNEDDDRIVGANASASDNHVISIANKEKRNVLQKAFTLPPSRNDALIWLARTFTTKDEFGEAAGLINILQNDPNLPQRLRNDLEEVTAYWFYKQKYYDSAAIHLEKGLTSADDKEDKARWQYLLAQLYETSGNYAGASEYYAKSAKHTTDPVMDIYARLNDAKMFRNTGDSNELKKSISNLLKMASKDKYEAYRDIIYFSAGELTVQRPDTATGITYYAKSLHYNESNAVFKNRAYLQLGNIAYKQGQYKSALNYYDSLQLADPSMTNDSAMIADRRESLSKIVQQLNIVELEDSLQMIAAMPAAARDAFIEKLERKYRKAEGDKADESVNGNTIISFNNKNSEPKDLFENSSKSGDWYFYNASLKSRGFNEFKTKWGKRQNTDNWRRRSAAEAAAKKNLNTNIDIDAPVDSSGTALGAAKPLDFSYDGLMANIPLSPEKLDSSKANIANALVTLAKLFQNELQDYQQAINTYEIYLQRFPDSLRNGEIYLGLYYSYSKIGDVAKAAYYKNLLSTKFAESRYAQMANDPSKVQPGKNNPQAEQRYADIYNLFLEGNFDSAVIEKAHADSTYGNNYWTPQLLYIEAVYHIRNMADSQAISTLKNLIALYPSSPLAIKSQRLIDVLGRRKEIESYLNNLQVTRAPEEEKVVVPDDKIIETSRPEVKVSEPKQISAPKNPVNKPDSNVVMPPSMVKGVYTWQSDKPHYIIMILNKVDPVYINEAKNAFTRYNRENYSGKTFAINKDVLDAEKSLLVFSSFENADEAVKYYDKIKKDAPKEVSWLQPNKYSFFIISENNLQLLKTNKDLDIYKSLLNAQYPGKF